MWGLISVGAYAGREDFMETFIRTLAMSYRKSPLARRRVSANLERIRRWLTSPNRKPWTDTEDPNDVVTNKQLYRDTLRVTNETLAHLQDILRDLPDAAADRLAARMAEETKDALADSP